MSLPRSTVLFQGEWWIYTSPFQWSSVHDFCQQEHGVGLEVEDHRQPFQSLLEVAQELTLQIHIPYLVARTAKLMPIPNEKKGWKIEKRGKKYWKRPDSNTHISNISQAIEMLEPIWDERKKWRGNWEGKTAYRFLK